MTDETKQEIAQLEETLSFLLKANMTRDEKIKALSDSFWRSHNAGYCDHIAGMQKSGTIIAINPDKDAPIFDYADYGIIADAFKM